MNLKELSANLGLEEDEYRELIELFIESGGSYYAHLKAALASNDADQVARNAHTIKGAAGNLGLMEVQDTAKQIELNAASGRLEGLEVAVQTLDSQFKQIEAFIHG